MYSSWFHKKCGRLPLDITSLALKNQRKHILRTISSVCLDCNNEFDWGCSTICNIDKMIKKDPGLVVGKFKSFFEKPQCECGNAMISSLPFKLWKMASWERGATLIGMGNGC